MATAHGSFRWSVGACLSVLVSLSFGFVPASAAAPPTPTPTNKPPYLGILSERRMVLDGRPARSAPVRRSQPLVTCSAAWRSVDNKSGTWNSFLGGVAAVSPTDMWAVGNSQDQISGNDMNLSEHWDGTAWTTVAMPQLGPDGNDLNDVAAISSNDVWAIGISNTTGFYQATAFHWNGTSWTAVNPVGRPSPNFFNTLEWQQLVGGGQSRPRCW